MMIWGNKAMNSDKKKLIAEYALSNEDNLILTAQVVKTFDYILEKLVIDVMEDLESELEDILGKKWTIYNNIKDKPLGRSNFAIMKNTWKDLYVIGFMPGKTRLRNFNFYVWRDSDIVKEPIKNGILTTLLNENYKKGNSYENGDWWQYVDKEYENWTDEENLKKLYNKTEIVSYFKNQLLRIKEIIEPIIDKEIKSYF